MRGRDCYTYYDVITDWAAATAPTLIGKIINETVSPEAEVASGGSRESVWTDSDVANLSLKWTGTYRYKKGPSSNDAVFLAMETAFLANTPIIMYFLDGPYATTGSEGFKAPMKITKMPQKNDLGDMVEIELEGVSCIYDDGGTLRVPVRFVKA